MKLLLTSDILLSLPEKGIRIGGYLYKKVDIVEMEKCIYTI